MVTIGQEGSLGDELRMLLVDGQFNKYREELFPVVVKGKVNNGNGNCSH